MKKYLALILVFVFIGTMAYAEPCPLPCSANTDAEILFKGFEWYTDYPTVKATAIAKGMSDSWYFDWFSEDTCTTPHWKTLVNSIGSFAGSETGCGGSLQYYTDVPDVAGYKVDSLDLYFMWKLNGYKANYKDPNATQFYMAKYELDVDDTVACYRDLVEKLKTIYGNKPYSDSYGWLDPTEYTLWVNGEEALVGVSYDSYKVYLVYMAPGAEQKLVEVENYKRKQQIERAKDDMTGL